MTWRETRQINHVQHSHMACYPTVDFSFFLIRIVKIIYLLWNRSKYDQDIYYVLRQL